MTKTPSHKLDIEYQMIATVILCPELIKTLPIKQEHFYQQNNNLAFKVLKKMDDDGESITLVTFGSRFWDVKGEITEINALFGNDFYYSSSHAETHLKILAEETAKRKILEKYNTLADAPLEFIDEMKKIELDFIDQKPKSLYELYDGYVEEYEERKIRLKEKGATGLLTGFKMIDEQCGFEQGNLIILAAKTNVGKTALALNFAVAAAMYEQKVLFFSAEMTKRELMGRIFAQLTGISATRFKYATADYALKSARIEIESCGKYLKIVEAANMTSDDVCRISRQEQGRGKIDFVVVDYLQYMKDPIGKNTNNDRIGNITRNFKGLAMELECPVLALSQVNRATKGVPELFNLRDSGNIEQDSDIVLILDREDRDDIVADLIVAKNRNGQLIKTQLKFQPELTKFTEYEK